MTFLSFFANLLCKKRKSSKASHATSPAKKSSSKRVNSSNEESRRVSRLSQPDQEGSDDDLRDSIQTQKILESEDEDDHSEMEDSQRSFHQNGEVSAAIASSPQKKEHVNLIRGNKHEKGDLCQPPRVEPGPGIEGFVQGEGSQPRIRRNQNNQDGQRGNQEERVQGRAEQQTIRQIKDRIPSEVGATKIVVEAENESLFSSKLSYQESEEEKKKKRALEDLERFNFTRIRFRKDKEMHETDKKHQGKKYLAFCQEAGVDAYKFYKEFTENNPKTTQKESLQERIKTLLEKDGFKTDKLCFTSLNLPHKTYASQGTKEWLFKYGYYDEI